MKYKDRAPKKPTAHTLRRAERRFYRHEARPLFRKLMYEKIKVWLQFKDNLPF